MRSPYPPSDDFSSSGGVRSTRAVPARSSAAPAESVTTIDPTIRAEAAIPAKKRTRIELCMALYPPGGVSERRRVRRLDSANAPDSGADRLKGGNKRAQGNALGIGSEKWPSP